MIGSILVLWFEPADEDNAISDFAAWRRSGGVENLSPMGDKKSKGGVTLPKVDGLTVVKDGVSEGLLDGRVGMPGKR